MRILGGLAALAAAHLTACSCGGSSNDIDAAPLSDAAGNPDAASADAMPDPAPGPVTDLTATPTAGNDAVDLTWTNPTD
ncbi:MAG TPA: hypothetical protein VL172_05045, partial [Kofleriaceae bacterium]|nr:hypothetical protein [Kofleriaceae bacterium]